MNFGAGTKDQCSVKAIIVDILLAQACTSSTYDIRFKVHRETQINVLNWVGTGCISKSATIACILQKVNAL